MIETDIKALNERIQQESAFVDAQEQAFWHVVSDVIFYDISLIFEGGDFYGALFDLWVIFVF